MALQPLALIGYAGFLLATFGWRTLHAKATRGEWSWRRPVSRTDAIGEVVCVAGCVLSLGAPVLAIARAVRPPGIDLVAMRGLLSILCLGFGTGIALRAQRHLADDWRAGVEASASLVTTGPFARVRNPFYLGCFFASAAVLVAVPTIVALGGFALHVAAAEVIVRRVEEPMLSEAHGDEYARYKARTGRFLPPLTSR
ncbi:MAG: methyltransferase family protein [Acidimicrobiales bacterium]